MGGPPLLISVVKSNKYALLGVLGFDAKGGHITYENTYHSSYGNHSHTKIAPLVTKITYIKMDPLRSIRHGFANGRYAHSHFYAAWTSRHESSMIPKALKFATLQKKMAPIPPHT